MHLRKLLNLYVRDRLPVIADDGQRLMGTVRFLTARIGHKQVEDFGQADIDTYVEERVADGARPSTARRELSVVIAALRLGARKGLRPPLPEFLLPRPGRPRHRVLSKDEITRLVEAAKEVDYRLFIFVLLGLCTGARRTALLELTWDRVDLVNGVVDLVAPHPRASRRKPRAVAPISPIVVKALEPFRPASGRGPVFGLSRDQMRVRFRAAADRAELGPDVTPHVLRHTAATVMIKSVPIIIASRMLGHTTTAITERVYVHTVPDDLRRAATAAAEMLPLQVAQPVSQWCRARNLIARIFNLRLPEEP